MKLSRDAAGPCLAPRGSVVAVGALDGLHRGHQALLARVQARARALDAVPMVVSFEPLPRAFFAPQPVPRLSSVREKLCGFAAAGMAEVLLLRFNAQLSHLSADAFVRDVLVGRAGAREIWVGADFRYGHGRTGDVALLERLGAELGFAVATLPAVQVDGARVSASRIRTLLAAGEFAGVLPLLGRAFTITGKVRHGRRLGRDLGYPTANIALPRRVSPVQGVFAVRAGLDDGGCLWPGVASLGMRPTVNPLDAPLLEVHLFDFDGDLYGRRMTVEFVAKLRDERRFPDLPALEAQMARDAAMARDALGMNPRLGGLGAAPVASGPRGS